MAAETIGMFISMFWLNLVIISTFRGNTSEYCGMSKTSSNVNPNGKIFVIFVCFGGYLFFIYTNKKVQIVWLFILVYDFYLLIISYFFAYDMSNGFCKISLISSIALF